MNTKEIVSIISISLIVIGLITDIVGLYKTRKAIEATKDSRLIYIGSIITTIGAIIAAIVKYIK